MTAFLIAFVCAQAQTPEIKINIGHSSPISDVCYSWDEKLIASLTFTEIKIWENISRKELRSVPLNGVGFPRKILFTPDNKGIIIGKWHTEGISLVDIVTGNIRSIEMQGFDIVDMAISPSHEYLAVSSNKSLHLIKLNGFTLVKTIPIENVVKGLAFNNASTQVLIGVSDGLVARYDIIGSNLTLDKFPVSSKPLRVAFAPELNRLICANSDYGIELWDTSAKKLLRTVFRPDFAFPAVDINQVDGSLLIGGTKDMMVRLFTDGATDPVLLGPQSAEVQLVKFSPSGKYAIATTSSWYNENKRHGLMQWHAGGLPAGDFGTGFVQSNPVFVSGTSVVSEQGNELTFWNKLSGDITSIEFPQNNRGRIILNADDIYALRLASPGKYEIHDLVRKQLVLSFDMDIPAEMKATIWVSGDGQKALVTGLKYYLPDRAEEVAKVFDLKSGALELEFTNKKSGLIDRAYFMNSNKSLCLVGDDFKSRKASVRHVNILSKKITEPFKIQYFSNVTVMDDTTLLNISKKSAQRLNILRGTKRDQPFPIDSIKINPVSNLLTEGVFKFSPTRFDGGSNRLFIGYGTTVKIINMTSGIIEASLTHSSSVEEIFLTSSDTILAVSTSNATIKYWDLRRNKEVLEVINYSDKDWLARTPQGLFDGSPGAMERLYFVNGLDIVEFAQLKARYYEPGLVKKVLTGGRLRNTVGFMSIDLPPDLRVGGVDDRGYLPIELINRGGGIGEVAVFIQGKEVTKDARTDPADPNVPRLKINYYIGNHKNLVKGENIIGVKAWNKDHWIESRSSTVTYNKDVSETYKPAVHILTCGVSDYEGSEIDLTYAAKDAEDVSKALKLGAARLFGTQRSYVYNLTTSQPKEFRPTKSNIIKTFNQISSTAHPLDVIVVYLSGHGVTAGGAEEDWFYLTQEATPPTRTSYNDPAIRNQTTISSNELIELFKAIPAAKQVLMIDACASGKVVDNLIAKRDVPSGALRALDRMKDRTGMHIITGCTADAVSYEASRYGQGVLTYSLLEGIRGAALRDYEFVDVNALFQYAHDRVPALAHGIGGIQTPMIFSPSGSQSFDIGQMSETDRKEVPISKIRPVYIQSNFQEEDELSDVLGLAKKIDLMLYERASKGIDAPLIFVPVREYPDGCQLVGRYKSHNGKIDLRLRRKCEGKDVTTDITASGLDDLAAQIIHLTSH